MTEMDHSVSQTPQTTRDDYTIDQDWHRYTPEEHDVWRALYRRQCNLLPGLAVPEFSQGLELLGMSENHIPNFAETNETLKTLTGWQVVAVPDLVPDAVFFEHLANRRFPAGRFIRTRSQLDYLQEPDVFHDVFGHVPLLANEVFADYLEAYGQGGLRALGRDCLHQLARLYWYTVEFGLVDTPEGLRIYGAGILSSKTESVFSLQDESPHRVNFDLLRLMRTNYRIDDFQEIYFVIDGFDQLFGETLQDFGAIYDALEILPELAPGELDPNDVILNKGTGTYATMKSFQSAV